MLHKQCYFTLCIRTVRVYTQGTSHIKIILHNHTLPNSGLFQEDLEDDNE